MRKCSMCNEEKSVSEFHYRNKKKKTLASRCKTCAIEVAKNHSRVKYSALSDQDKLQRRALRHKINHLMYSDLMELQGGKCAICKEVPPTAIDHDHRCCPGTYSCGQCVRGLLCDQCNMGIGNLRDSVERLESAIEYLKTPAHGWSLTKWGLMATRKIEAINKQVMGE